MLAMYWRQLSPASSRTLHSREENLSGRRIVFGKVAFVSPSFRVAKPGVDSVNCKSCPIYVLIFVIQCMRPQNVTFSPRLFLVIKAKSKLKLW